MTKGSLRLRSCRSLYCYSIHYLFSHNSHSITLSVRLEECYFYVGFTAEEEAQPAAAPATTATGQPSAASSDADASEAEADRARKLPALLVQNDGALRRKSRSAEFISIPAGPWQRTRSGLHDTVRLGSNRGWCRLRSLQMCQGSSNLDRHIPEAALLSSGKRSLQMARPAWHAPRRTSPMPNRQ